MAPSSRVMLIEHDHLPRAKEGRSDRSEFQSSYSEVVAAKRKAEARAWRRNKSLAMRHMYALADSGLRESTKGRNLEGKTGSRS